MIFNNSENRFMLAAIFAVIIIAGSCLVFFIAPELNDVFWISYLFTLLALIGLALAILFSAGSLRNVIANQSIVTVAVLYLIVEIVITLCFGIIFTISGMWYLAVHAAVLLVFVVLGLVMQIGRKTIVHLGEDTRKKVISRDLLTFKAEQLSKKSRNLPDEMKGGIPERLDKLAEMIRYSDPMTPESLQDLDVSIERELDLLDDELSHVTDQETDAVPRLNDRIGALEDLIRQRNKQMKILK